MPGPVCGGSGVSIGLAQLPPAACRHTRGLVAATAASATASIARLRPTRDRNDISGIFSRGKIARDREHRSRARRPQSRNRARENDRRGQRHGGAVHQRESLQRIRLRSIAGPGRENLRSCAAMRIEPCDVAAPCAILPTARRWNRQSECARPAWRAATSAPLLRHRGGGVKRRQRFVRARLRDYAAIEKVAVGGEIGQQEVRGCPTSSTQGSSLLRHSR